MMTYKIIKLFLRFALAIGFLSAVADRFGFWGPEASTWGTWDAFLAYTQVISPWFPAAMIPAVGLIATVAEVVLAIGLLVGYKTEGCAKLSGILLLIFGLSMSFSIGVKAPLDYSVFAASGGAFALSLLKEKYLEVDLLFAK